MFPDCQCLRDYKLLVEMKVPREERRPLWNGRSRPAVIEAAPCIPIYFGNIPTAPCDSSPICSSSSIMTTNVALNVYL